MPQVRKEKLLAQHAIGDHDVRIYKGSLVPNTRQHPIHFYSSVIERFALSLSDKNGEFAKGPWCVIEVEGEPVWGSIYPDSAQKVKDFYGTGHTLHRTSYCLALALLTASNYSFMAHDSGSEAEMEYAAQAYHTLRDIAITHDAEIMRVID